MIKELWLAQPRFLQRSKVKAFRTLSHPRFRACYDFYALRAEAGDADPDVAAWWERFQFADEGEREGMLLPDDEPKRKKRRRKKRTDGAATSNGPSGDGAPPAMDAE
jgi:poly(A) polymerase